MTATTVKPRRFRLHRSELAVPATSEHFFEKAALSAADVVFLDLEDAVAPGMKLQGRKNAVAALNDLEWAGKTMAVRVNSLDTEWGIRDIIELATHCPRLDMILLPKAGTATDIQFVDILLGGIERDIRRVNPIGIEVLIESALGLANVEQIAASSDRLEALIFGVGDYSVDLRTFDRVFGDANPDYAMLTGADAGGKRERHWNDQWHYALARIANACRAYGLRPIDGPFANYGDPEGFLATARRAAALGFEGKWAIHPSQIELAKDAFTPSTKQIDWAEKLIGTIRGAEAEGKGAVGVGGVLIDFAHEKLARHLLTRAEAAGSNERH
jgi:malyl-CoA/(S)-citramalyl-CoA lyase